VDGRREERRRGVWSIILLFFLNILDTAAPGIIATTATTATIRIIFSSFGVSIFSLSFPIYNFFIPEVTVYVFLSFFLLFTSLFSVNFLVMFGSN